MGKKKKKRASDVPEDGILLIRNKRGRHDFEIEEQFEAGLVLVGSEVKALRDKRGSLSEGHIDIRNGEAWLLNAQIQEYAWANQFNHSPERRRKLLLHRREIKKIDVRITQRGFTGVPLALYLRGGRVKLSFGIGRGRREFEKRHVKRDLDAKRELARIIRK